MQKNKNLDYSLNIIYKMNSKWVKGPRNATNKIDKIKYR